ncbi:hypothetical protein G9F72_011405 [Clostridium estertheticum]|uniref:hypothetical protein n=1 Tax=Clostridium estertheticum TaxID=238834 RepID=UPI001CD05557|nr:hypothetical protein [Clostridium estertheticum]MBZ9686932.1 hypothetical protein [Clostridium estertheticum]
MFKLKRKGNKQEILRTTKLKSNNGVERNESHMPTITNVAIKDADSLVVKKIKRKLNDAGGQAIVTLYSGDSCDICFDEGDKGLVSSKVPSAEQLVWEAFDAAVEVVINNGGKAKKGNAQSGAKLGSAKLMINSVEGYIAHKVHGVEEGGTAVGAGFVICAVLDWVEICRNEKWYLSIEPLYLEEYKTQYE